MTLLLIGAGYCGGLITAAGVPLLVAWLAKHRDPIQQFCGRVFPHPLDERWELGRGSATFGPITVIRERICGAETGWTRLRIGDVEIDAGERADRYLRAITGAAIRRERDRALEAIP